MAPSKVTITNNRARNKLLCKFFFTEVSAMSWIEKNAARQRQRTADGQIFSTTFAVALARTYAVCLTTLALRATKTATMVASVVTLFD